MVISGLMLTSLVFRRFLRYIQIMAEMTEEEADALDELWTKTTPEIEEGKGSFFTKRRARMLLLDESTVRILDTRAKSFHQTPTEFITQLIRKEMIAAI